MPVEFFEMLSQLLHKASKKSCRSPQVGKINCVLGLVVSREEGSRVRPERSVLF
jgi:hypothetical protein